MSSDWSYWLILFFGPVLLATPFIWPFVYIKLRKGNNTLLFVSMSVGFMALIGAMLEILVYPIEIYMRHFYPQLKATDIQTLDWLASISNFLDSYYWAIVIPPIYFLVPVFVYRRYKSYV